MSEHDIKEFIYFDIEKAISIYSQLDDGLLKEEHYSTSSHEKINPDISAKVFGVGTSLTGEKQTAQQKSLYRIPHHNILSQLESGLSEAGLLSSSADLANQDIEAVWNSIKKSTYIKVSGPSTFENLRRVNKLLPDFNKTREFLGGLNAKIPTINDLIEKGMTRGEAERQVTILKKKQKDDTKEAIDDKHLKNMTKFFKDYLEERIVFRVQPFANALEVQIRAQLRDPCFLFSDEDHLSFCYGLNPKMNMTILGLITSLPAKDESDERLYTPPSNINGASGEIEEKLRVFIESFENLKSMVSFDRYPVVTIYPIAIYRSIPYKKVKV